MMVGAGAFAALGLAARPALAIDIEALHKAPALGEMAMGPDDAKVTVIEYASATCPHCADFYNDTFGALKTEYIDTGKIRFVFREFPHNDGALAAFMLARCAPKEKYFALVDIFFATQPQWTQSPRDGLLNIAKQAGFSEEAFNKCLGDEALAKGIREIRSTAEGFGVTGIPTFFINGEMIGGEQKIEDLRKIIDPLLG
jgi:protein-disulfide isomerase